MKLFRFFRERPLVGIAFAAAAGCAAGVVFPWYPLPLVVCAGICALLIVSFMLGKSNLLLPFCLLSFFLFTLCAGWRAHPDAPVTSGTYMLSGTIAEEILPRSSGGYRTVLRDVRFTDEEDISHGIARMYWTFAPDENTAEEIPAESLRIGDRVSFRGSIYRPLGRMNPYGFDFRLYLLGRNIACAVSGFKDVRVIQTDCYDFSGRMSVLRERISKHLENVFQEGSAWPKALLLGENNIEKLASARVIIFGIGGVGGYVTEALARTGIGHLELVDSDRVSRSNINRQIIALQSTIGRYKTEVMKERILDINPSAEVITRECFFLPENASEFDFTQYDYVVDAVDTVTAKISLIMAANAAGTPIISSMGAGNKLDPTKFQVADIYKTSICPLAKVMRRELRKRGIKKLKCVYSTEESITPEVNSGAEELSEENTNTLEEKSEKKKKKKRKKAVPGSVAFVPSAAGLIIAGEVVKDLLEITKISQ